MASFKDKTGDLWTLEITYQDVLRVREVTEKNSGRRIDLLKPHEGSPPASALLASDLDMFCDVLHTLLETQLKAASLGMLDFVGRLGGQELCDANDAFLEAWTDFFQKRRQPAQAELIRKSADMQAQLNRIAAEEASTINTAEEAGKVMTKLLPKRETATNTNQKSQTGQPTLNSSSGGSPESSESGPTATASGSST